MKKVLIVFLICIFACFLNKSFAYENGTYKVIKVIDGDTLYLDFNNDGRYQKEEKVRINGIDTFEVKPSVFLDWQMKKFNLTQSEALGLGYFGKEFAKKNLLNKYVKAEYSADTKTCDMGRQLMSISYDNGKSYEQEVLKAGLATVYKKSNIAPELYKYENLEKIKSNVKKTHWLNLVLLNKKNNTYHKVNCEYGLMASNVELINKSLFSNYKPTSCCYPELVKNKKEKPYKIYINIVKPDAEENSIEIFFLSPLKQKKPENECKTGACKALLYNIDNAKESIDFAIYGIDGQDRIFNALLNAQKRGVKIRWVTDMTENNQNIYPDTIKLMKKIPTVRDDYESFDSLHIPDYKYKLEYQGAIMHDKFFIFDNQKVFTGSTNISSTCLTGFNSNVAILIDSKAVANIYEQEFAQMYSGKFHTEKKPVLNNENLKFKDNLILSIYFSPANKISTSKIIPLIKSAQNYIYIPAFYLTHIGITNELIEAKNRGVDIKIIIDESSLQSKYSTKEIIKKSGIDVKVEHWAGKMHMKSLIIDDKTLVIGSMNFTSQGENRNDENTLIIENASVLTKAYKKHFLELWNSIK